MLLALLEAQAQVDVTASCAEAAAGAAEDAQLAAWEAPLHDGRERVAQVAAQGELQTRRAARHHQLSDGEAELLEPLVSMAE